jgi:hypothetical protein
MKNIWDILQTRTALKILLRPVTNIVYNCVFLTNLHTCFYGSEVGKYFDAAKLKPEVYLRDL